MQCVRSASTGVVKTTEIGIAVTGALRQAVMGTNIINLVGWNITTY